MVAVAGDPQAKDDRLLTPAINAQSTTLRPHFKQT